MPEVSLYASYTRSFQQVVGTTFDRRLFKPERGTQWEVGVKTDLTDKLSATLAYYNITRSNVLADDPENAGFSVQTGEQNSQGVELDIAGEILPGWKIIASAAYTDAKVTEDADFSGNKLNNVPEFGASLWTTYEIQRGDLQGLGFGFGLFYVGERQGDIANTFTLPSYVRTDAAIFYQEDNFRASINIKNLFNIEYFESARNDREVFPGDPLTVVGSVSWKF
ncbi:TonB-dependent siderophore receptor [Fischerella thermalis]|uniref:TonB-dependent siderophore receptor n=1 Tax=Fischerella thermalis TaxID=372787 RepID=UPI00215DABE8|nr:TonB-dependent receptor [Fischerella thermalis]